MNNIGELKFNPDEGATVLPVTPGWRVRQVQDQLNSIMLFEMTIMALILIGLIVYDLALFAIDAGKWAYNTGQRLRNTPTAQRVYNPVKERVVKLYHRVYAEVK